MGLSERLHRLLPDLAAVLLRFPVPVLASVLLCLYLNLEEGSGHGPADDDVIYGAAAAFIAAGAAHLFAEARSFSRTGNVALALVCGLAAAATGIATTYLATAPLFLFAGLVLALMVAPYLTANARQGALWLYNLRLGLAALLAVIVGLAMAGGLSAIVEALNFLFNVDLPNNLHEHIWETAASLVAPIYGLALMPRNLAGEVDLDAAKGSLLERGVSVLVNYVLVPIVIVYALILHAYAVKIALDWQLPKGQIGAMVSIFALGGTGAWLIAWPWRETGTWLLRFFIGNWFRLTFIPAILLVLAVWRRVSDYGVTPERYGLILIALWLALLGAYLAYRRSHADMRAILGSLAVLLLIGSMGPWGAKGMTATSQFSRLKALLEDKGALKDDKLVLSPPKLDETARSGGNSMLWALQQVDGLERLKPWFAGRTDDPFNADDKSWDVPNKVAEQLGLNFATPVVDQVSFTALTPGIFAANSASAHFIGPLRAMNYRPESQQRPEVTATVEADDFVVRVGERRWAHPLRSLLEKIKAGSADKPENSKTLAIEIAPDMTLIVDSAYGALGDTPQLSSGVFWIVLRDQSP